VVVETPRLAPPENDAALATVLIDSCWRDVMIRILSLACSVAAFSAALAVAEDDRQVLEIEIDASIDQVWDAFTTTAGLKSWAAPLADVDFKIGGKWRANYNAQGKLGDATTIENTILSYDPRRMLSIRPTRFPQGFPFVEAARQTWTVFYFSPVTKARTKLRLVGLGYTDDKQSQQLRAFFLQGNKFSLQKLAQALVKDEAKKQK
jgi:uncharacterized protein YndB with AHSA1/START domain